MDSRTRVQTLSSKLFTSDVLELMFLCVPRLPCKALPKTKTLVSHTVTSESSLSECIDYLKHSKRAQSMLYVYEHIIRRIYSSKLTTMCRVIYQKHSWSRLQLTATAYNTIAVGLEVSPIFHEITTAFGVKTSDDERWLDGIRSCSNSRGCSTRLHGTLK